MCFLGKITKQSKNEYTNLQELFFQKIIKLTIGMICISILVIMDIMSIIKIEKRNRGGV